MSNSDQFLEKAKASVRLEHNSTCRDGYELSQDEVYIVWFAKTLGNWKALISTDKFNGTYWEVTHNGAKDETYVDRYVKANNVCITSDGSLKL
ncbi:hypothetical protein SEA_CASSEROLE_8 [Arthrobacter phage Casserole]|nr:hypothetical protein SEA_CASSEROLE_8 [Arthrobacter phage Casserole]